MCYTKFFRVLLSCILLLTAAPLSGVQAAPAGQPTLDKIAAASGQQVAAAPVMTAALEPLTTYIVSGTITDAAAGWPLYASLTITGTPTNPAPPNNQVWTDPVTGFYSVTLAEGITYTFSVAAQAAGYLPVQQIVGPLTGDQTRDYTLNADLTTCTAPGYAYTGATFFEGFDAVTPPDLPAGWAMSIITDTETSPEWATSAGTRHPADFSAASAPNLVYFNSYDADRGGAARLYQTSGVSLTTAPTKMLVFQVFHDTGYASAADRVQAQVSTDGSATWQSVGAPVWRYDGSTGWKAHVIDLSVYASAADLRLGFLGIGDYGNDLHLDNIQLGASCTPQAGGLVMGSVFDDNTHLALNGAQVSSDSGQSATTLPTSDPALPGSVYTLFAPAGSHVLTATMFAYGFPYGPVTMTPTVVLSDTIWQDFSLPAGKLVLSGSLTATVNMGASASQLLTLTNVGGLPAWFESELRPAKPWVSINTVSGTIAAGAAQPITLTFDAGMPAVTKPGEYSTLLYVGDDTPYPYFTGTVTLIATAPASYGVLTGTVKGIACDVNPTPMPGAVVYVESGTGYTRPLTTGADGVYTFWLDQANSPLTVTVSNEAGYEAQTASGIWVTGTQTTTHNFNLRLYAPCATLTPGQLSSAQAANQVTTKTLTIGNAGAWSFDWNIGGSPMSQSASEGQLKPIEVVGVAGTGHRPAAEPQYRMLVQNTPPILNAPLTLINDGSFENDPSAWTEVDTTDCTPWIGDWSDNVGVTPVHGEQYFWAGGYCGAPNSNSAAQVVTVPAGNPLLSFYYYADRTDVDDATNGTAYVKIDNTPVFTLTMSQANNTDGWVKATVDVHAFAGQSVILKLGADNPGPNNGNVFFDLVEFVVPCPAAPAWVSASPVSGTLGADGQTAVNVTFNSTGLATGLYTGNLCVNTTDPRKSTVFVPVSLGVSDCAAKLNNAPTIYPSVQAAVDASTVPSDVVKAAGYCPGVETRAGLAQTVIVTKSLTIRGGYTTTNWTTPYPITQPTTLDAVNLGRVILIKNNASVTLENLNIVNGNGYVGGLPGGESKQWGGGVFALTSTLHLLNSQVSYNTGCSGGGVANEGGVLTLTRAALLSNTVGSTGGGLINYRGQAVMNDSQVLYNRSAHDSGGLANADGQLTVNRSTIAYNVTNPTAQQSGYGIGGLDNTACDANSSLTINDSQVIGNASPMGTGGGGIGNHSAAGWRADLVVNRSTIALNTTTSSSALAGFGGGIKNGAMDPEGNCPGVVGGMPMSFVTVNDSVIKNNSATNGGGIGNGALPTGMPTPWMMVVTLNNTTVSGNVAGVVTGGVVTQTGNGGGIFNVNGTVTAINSTVSGNTASTSLPTMNSLSGLGGGIGNAGAGLPTGIVLTHTTIAGNVAYVAGAGVVNAYLLPMPGGYPATVATYGTIIANNTAGGGAVYAGCLNVPGYGTATITSRGYNLERGNTCGLNATGDLTNTNPLLGALANNGGPVTASGLPAFTHALLKGSPALNVIPAAACKLSTDQRGQRRPAGPGCDSGAYEAQYTIYLPLIRR